MRRHGPIARASHRHVGFCIPAWRDQLSGDAEGNKMYDDDAGGPCRDYSRESGNMTVRLLSQVLSWSPFPFNPPEPVTRRHRTCRDKSLMFKPCIQLSFFLFLFVTSSAHHFPEQNIVDF